MSLSHTKQAHERSTPTAGLRGERISMVLGSLEMGGTERQAIHLAKYLRDHAGASVRISALETAGAAAAVCDELGIPWDVFSIRLGKNRLTRWSLPALRLVPALRAQQPDVVLSYTSPPNILCGLVWRYTGAKICIWNQRDEGRGLGSRAAALAIRRVSAITSNTKLGADYLSDRFRLKNTQISIIRNGVLLGKAKASREVWRQRLMVDDHCFVACMVANITPFKDHETLIRAWRSVLTRLRSRPAVLLLAGLPIETIPLKALAFDLQLGQSVRFLGQVDDIPGLLSAVDLAVFSSRTEGCPNGVLESMAVGLAVVGTAIPGIREAVGPDGEDWLVPQGDSEALAETIVSLATDDEQRTRLGISNRDRIKTEFNPERMGQETVNLIVDALRHKGRCGS